MARQVHVQRIARYVVLLAWVGILILHAPSSSVRILITGFDSSVYAKVQAVHGTIEADWPHTRTIVAHVPTSQVAVLAQQGLHVHQDSAVYSAINGELFTKKPPLTPLYPSQATNARQLHQRGLDGNNVGIAIIDSGMPPIMQQWTQINSTTLEYPQGNRDLVYKDVLTDVPITNSSDPFGHGTHVLATVADGRQVGGNNYLGVAPQSDIIVVRALDETGSGTYADVIEAIEWIITNKDVYNIKVLNLSLQAPIHGPYWHDPLAQAVMAAWDADITVVVAAGNQGPAPATVTVPGNVPYVITVGSLKPGLYTESQQDELAIYSSAGPTESKFVKPDVVVAGSRVIAPLPQDSALRPYAGPLSEAAKIKVGSATSQEKLNYYYLSGTSMAAAEVSGIVALLLQDEPNLTNDQIKARLTSTAQRAIDHQGLPAYSIWQQGAGRLDAVAAVDSTSTEAANVGLDLSLDRDHEQGTHYVGDTTYDQTTNMFALANLTEPIPEYTTWFGAYEPGTGSFTGASGYGIWTGGYGIWTGSYPEWQDTYHTWAGGYGIWTGSTSVWSSGYGIWTGHLAPDESNEFNFLPTLYK